MRHAVDLLSVSFSTDAAWLAVQDVARLTANLNVDYRLVGGNAVELLVHRHSVSGLVPPRETADADLAAYQEVCADPRLVPALTALGYQQVEGNRFVRAEGTRELIIDILMPSYTSRLRPNQTVGDLVIDGIPGLVLALTMPPTQVDLRVAMTDGTALTMSVDLPDVRAALALKAFAYSGRLGGPDAIDVARLLEAAYASGHRAEDWPATATGRDAARLLWRDFGPTGKAVPNRNLRVRVRALLAQVVPAPQEVGSRREATSEHDS